MDISSLSVSRVFGPNGEEKERIIEYQYHCPVGVCEVMQEGVGQGAISGNGEYLGLMTMAGVLGWLLPLPLSFSLSYFTLSLNLSLGNRSC